MCRGLNSTPLQKNKTKKTKTNKKPTNVHANRTERSGWNITETSDCSTDAAEKA